MTEPIPIHREPDWADRRNHPGYYSGILAKRMIAYAIDALAIMAIVGTAWAFLLVLGLFTLGLAWHLLLLPGLAVPLLYHSLLIAGPRSATIGMRVMGIRVMSIAPLAAFAQGRPRPAQAVIQTVAFYGSVALTGSLILLVALFNERRRTLHDWLAETVTVNDIRP
ncbi:MAG: RDD family protein [Magnetospirillum sp.]|nr:RDD family protein [Magnetospirillum sp.]